MIVKLKVSSERANIRLDNFLNLELPEYSRSYFSQLNEQEKIKVNNKKVKNGYKVCENDEIEIDIVEKKEITAEPEDISLDIVFEDDDMIVINKPQGLCVHPAVGNESHTLVNALSYKFKNLSDINGQFRLGIVHRLDKDTSGLMLVAKNNKAHENLASQISTKTCKRKYLALVVGSFKESSGIIERNLTRSKKNRLKYEVCGDFEGRTATTLYRTIEIFKGYSLVEFELKTGRTHQIRVHSSFMGHPIVGDKLYGVKDNFNLKGQLLTAYKISFNSVKTNELMEFCVDLPQYFKNVLEILRNKN